MWNTVLLRDDFTASEVRALATRTRDSAQARRLLSIAAVYDGLNRGDAARIVSVILWLPCGPPIFPDDGLIVHVGR